MKFERLPNRKIYVATVIALLGTVIGFPALADVSTDSLDENLPPFIRFVITRTIRNGDYLDMVRAVDSIKTATGVRPIVHVRLDSPGGDVLASLKIGRLLRKYGALAVVDANANCLSSCVYILAGAPLRSVEGAVGIHRPYDPDDKATSVVSQNEKYKRWGVEIVAYLKEMNVPTRLYDDSLFISPERVKLLTESELQAYGLSENDPYQDEANAVRQALRLGISRVQLGERRVKARSECGLDSVTDATPREEILQRVKCEVSILEGK